MIETFKIKNKLASPIMDSIFERRNEPYNLHNFQEFLTEKKELCIMVLTIVHTDYVNLIYRILDFFKVIYIATIYNV